MTKEIAPEQRRAAAQKAAETYRRHRQKQAEMAAQRREEQAAQLAALRRVRDNPDSSSAEVLRAIELLMELDK